MIPLGSEGIAPDLEIIETPGHCEHHQSLLVQTATGIVAIAGDVFWFWDSCEIPAESGFPNDDEPFDSKLLQRSRQILLKQANLIIPGHGKPLSSQKLSTLLGW